MTNHADRKPPGTLSPEECCDLIYDRTERTVDVDQWRAIAKRRGVRRVTGSRLQLTSEGKVINSRPYYYYVERDVRKQLSWLRGADDRQLEVCDPAELPTIEEIYREARLLRDMRDLTCGRVDSSDCDDDEWSLPTIYDLEG